MAKRIKQYRYYGDGLERNQPSGLTEQQLALGTIFESQISDLRIQSYPGTKFYLNESTDPVLIGSSGEYHLGLSGNYEIVKLQFDRDCIRQHFNNPNFNAHLIVDIIYNTNEE